MAITDFQVGEGHYALAYGEHIVSGILAGYDNTNPTLVKIKVLLGLGEWNALREVSYDGTIIDPTNYTFHRGTLSTGATDPVQGVDDLFPNSIFHSRIAYYSATLPNGLGAEERPDKMRVIAETLKVPYYNSSGTQLGTIYSPNPADVFADVVRRNCLRLKLNFTDHMDWPAYAAARAFYGTTIAVDDGKYTPRNVTIKSRSITGNLPAGTWYYKVASIGEGSNQSVTSPVVAVQTSGTTSKNTVSWDTVPGAAGYRVYYSYNNPTSFTSYFTVSGTPTFNHTTTTGAISGIPVTLPTGEWAKAEAEFQTHRAFTQKEVVTGDALSAIMFDAASEWVRDGKKYRILLPNRTSISHTLTVANTTDDGIEYAKVPPRERINRVTGTFRNRDNNWKPESQSPANNLTLQNQVGVVEEEVNLGVMSTSQVRRITNWRLREEHLKSRKFSISSQMDSEHLLVGDFVNVVDRQAGVRAMHGALESVKGSFATSSETNMSGGTWSLIEASPTGKSRPLVLDVPRGSYGSRYANITLGTPVPVNGSNWYIRFYVKVGGKTGLITPTSGIDEITVGLRNTSGQYFTASFRRPQNTSMVNYGTVSIVGEAPSRGQWVPMLINAADIGWSGSAIEFVEYQILGSGNVSFSEMTYYDATPRAYKVIEIEDGDSDSPGNRMLTLKEANLDTPYRATDAYQDLGIVPPTTYSPPAFSGSLSFSSNRVSGTFNTFGATGAVRILRKLSGGTYSEVGAVPYNSGSFSDAPPASGTYVYKLMQDGVSGSSGELTISVSLTGTGLSPSALYVESADPQAPNTSANWDFTLRWTNNGAVGDNFIERKIGAGSWTSYGDTPFNVNYYTDVLSPNQVYSFRVYNSSVAGYSNTVSISTYYFE